MILTGKIEAISISERKGIKKSNVPSAILKVEHGIIGDAHAGNWHRQISLLAIETKIFILRPVFNDCNDGITLFKRLTSEKGI